MKVDKVLKAIMAVILDEVRKNPDFAAKLGNAVGEEKPAVQFQQTRTKRSRRRSPAAFDPIAAYDDGENVLRQKLEPLNLEQLRDIVAEYGMDPGKLVMKWKTAARVIDHIVETSAKRACKGGAFR